MVLPRLKDLADQRLYRLERGPQDQGAGLLEPLFQERGRAAVDGALIAEQWDGLVRVATSLRERTASVHVVLQRLINASPADRLARALTALGRLVKTIFILRYVADAALRRRVQTQLNRGEAHHALARWLFFANHWGEFRTGEDEGDHEQGELPAACSPTPPGAGTPCRWPASSPGCARPGPKRMRRSSATRT